MQHIKQARQVVHDWPIAWSYGNLRVTIGCSRRRQFKGKSPPGHSKSLLCSSMVPLWPPMALGRVDRDNRDNLISTVRPWNSERATSWDFPHTHTQIHTHMDIDTYTGTGTSLSTCPTNRLAASLLVWWSIRSVWLGTYVCLLRKMLFTFWFFFYMALLTYISRRVAIRSGGWRSIDPINTVDMSCYSQQWR